MIKPIYLIYQKFSGLPLDSIKQIAQNNKQRKQDYIDWLEDNLQELWKEEEERNYLKGI